MRLVLGACTALAGAAICAGAVTAHHSSSQFDFDNIITVEGVVTEFDWANPHVYIYVDVAADDGEIVEWEVEGFPPTFMRRAGWSRETLAAGDVISVTGASSRRESAHGLFLLRVERDGDTLLAASDVQQELNEVAPAEDVTASGLAGIWIGRTSINNWNDPERLDLTELGDEAAAAFDEATMHPGLDCIPQSPPMSMYMRDIKQVIIEDDLVRIGTEFDGGERVIRVGEPETDEVAASVQGHAVGQWDDGDLVVETTDFVEHAMGNAFGLPSGPQKRLSERFSLSDDGQVLTYAFELHDPDYLSSPVIGESEWVYRPDVEFAPEDCVIENAQRFADE